LPAQRADFVEATVFEPELAVVMKGEFADMDTPEAAALINPISRWCHLRLPGRTPVIG
jgi:hypothetical protein